MSDKDEATRLADHLQQFILATNPSPNGNWRKTEALLRRWPDGEPVAVRCPDCIGAEQPGWRRGMRCVTCDGTATVAAPPAERIAALEREVEALRADAERYRFLEHDFSPMGLNIDSNHAWAYRRNATLKGPTLSAAIDAARGKTK